MEEIIVLKTYNWINFLLHSLFQAKFIKDNNYGIVVMYLEFDDITMACGCECPYIGFINIVAGYENKQQVPCQKFDMKNCFTLPTE